MQPQAFFPRGWDFRPLPKFPKLEAPRAISQGGGAARNFPRWGRRAQFPKVGAPREIPQVGGAVRKLRERGAWPAHVVSTAHTAVSLWRLNIQGSRSRSAPCRINRSFLRISKSGTIVDDYAVFTAILPRTIREATGSICEKFAKTSSVSLHIEKVFQSGGASVHSSVGKHC